MPPDWEVPPAEQRARVRSGDIDLMCEMRGSGAPLLLLHGWTLDQRVFKPQFAEFSRHYRTISFDRRGSGASGGQPDLSRELDDIQAVIAATCDGSPVHMLGQSQGGRLALRYAVSHPGAVRSLLLQGPALDQFEPQEQEDERVPMEDFSALARAGELAELRQRWLRHPKMQRGISAEAAELLAGIVADYKALDLSSGAAESFEFAIDMPVALRKLKLPVRILTGVEETAARKQVAAEILRLVAGADEVLLPGCGHMSNLCDPALFNRLALEFFSAH